MDDLFWTEPALQDLDDISAYVSLDSPRSAENLVSRIVQAVGMLSYQPRMGRAIEPGDVRRLVLAGTPYTVIYRLRERIEILTIFHTSRRWPDSFSGS